MTSNQNHQAADPEQVAHDHILDNSGSSAEPPKKSRSSETASMTSSECLSHGTDQSLLAAVTAADDATRHPPPTVPELQHDGQHLEVSQQSLNVDDYPAQIEKKASKRRQSLAQALSIAKQRQLLEGTPPVPTTQLGNQEDSAGEPEWTEAATRTSVAETTAAGSGTTRPNEETLKQKDIDLPALILHHKDDNKHGGGATTTKTMVKRQLSEGRYERSAVVPPTMRQVSERELSKVNRSPRKPKNSSAMPQRNISKWDEWEQSLDMINAFGDPKAERQLRGDKRHKKSPMRSRQCVQISEIELSKFREPSSMKKSSVGVKRQLSERRCKRSPMASPHMRQMSERELSKWKEWEETMGMAHSFGRGKVKRQSSERIYSSSGKQRQVFMGMMHTFGSFRENSEQRDHSHPSVPLPATEITIVFDPAPPVTRNRSHSNHLLGGSIHSDAHTPRNIKQTNSLRNRSNTNLDASSYHSKASRASSHRSKGSRASSRRSRSSGASSRQSRVSGSSNSGSRNSSCRSKSSTKTSSQRSTWSTPRVANKEVGKISRKLASELLQAFGVEPTKSQRFLKIQSRTGASTKDESLLRSRSVPDLTRNRRSSSYKKSPPVVFRKKSVVTENNKERKIEIESNSSIESLDIGSSCDSSSGAPSFASDIPSLQSDDGDDDGDDSERKLAAIPTTDIAIVVDSSSGKREREIPVSVWDAMERRQRQMELSQGEPHLRATHGPVLRHPHSYESSMAAAPNNSYENDIAIGVLVQRNAHGKRQELEQQQQYLPYASHSARSVGQRSKSAPFSRPTGAPLQPPRSDSRSKLASSSDSVSLAGNSGASSGHDSCGSGPGEQLQPGAYPTPGRAPFANVLMGGIYRGNAMEEGSLHGAQPFSGRRPFMDASNHSMSSWRSAGRISRFEATGRIRSARAMGPSFGGNSARSYQMDAVVGNSSMRSVASFGSHGYSVTSRQSVDASDSEIPCMYPLEQAREDLPVAEPFTDASSVDVDDVSIPSTEPIRWEADSMGDESNMEIVAVCVEEDDLENNIRDEIIRNSAHANIVNIEETEVVVQKRVIRQFLFCGITFILAAVILGAVIGFVLNEATGDVLGPSAPRVEVSEAPQSQGSLAPLAFRTPTLDRIRDEGVLRCGIYSNAGTDAETGHRTGPGVDLCRAVAAAAMGKKSYGVILVEVTYTDRFHQLTSGTIDLLASGSTITMDRDVYQVETGGGVSFTDPFIYDGMRVAGLPEFVKCADNDLQNFFECRDVLFCVVAGSTYYDILAARVPRKQIFAVADYLSLYIGLTDHHCNVVAGEGMLLAEENARALGYEGEYVISTSLFSKTPTAMATRNDDSIWLDFVNSVLNALFEAERLGITQNTSELARDAFIPPRHLFDERYEDMFVDAIASTGNIGEFYDRHPLHGLPWGKGLNAINNGTGLIYAYPFGNLKNNGPGPSQNGTLETILQRRKLRCAIRATNRPGFAEAVPSTAMSSAATNITETRARNLNHVPSDSSNSTLRHNYQGLDVDYCLSLSTSLFSGAVGAIEFVEAENEVESYILLSSGDVDVTAGARWNLQNDVREPFTQQGYTYSRPYFFGSDVSADISGPERGADNNLCLATRQDDPQWSAFVFWVVEATFYAEEKGITQRLSNQMPQVHLFGPDFKRMLRDPILEFGNYAELYERNVKHIPRSGRNLLNSILEPGPQIYPVPGLDVREDP